MTEKSTKDRILDIAQNLILTKGFNGTSLDEIISDAGITKGGFFYHFKGGKSELAATLMKRYLEEDNKFFESHFNEADDLCEDVLDRMLVFLTLLARSLDDLAGTHPGCLVASYTYESEQYDSNVKCLAVDGMKYWRNLFCQRFEEINKKYQPPEGAEPEELADMLTTIFEGAIIVSKVLGEPAILPKHILQFRNYIKLLYNK